MFGYRAQLPAMYLMLLFEPINSSMELVNRTRIWVEGGPEAIHVPDAEKLSSKPAVYALLNQLDTPFGE